MTYESTDALQFLVEDFIEVSDETLTEEATAGVSKFQAESARRLLPGPLTGAFSMQQLALTGMPPAEFQRLRRSVRDWLLSGLTYEWTINTIKGPLKIISGRRRTRRARQRKRRVSVEGSGHDVFWFYLIQLVDDDALNRIRVCHAPKSKKDSSQSSGETEPCGRLFIRRGEAKEYCSERCRARVATQRARAWRGPEGRKK